MELYVIPIEGKFILYRPLLRLAFVGNRAMADLTVRLVESPAHVEAPEEVRAFLEAIGFLQPDPPPPPAPDGAYCPTAAVLLLTNRCNLRCTYCYADGGTRPPRDLSLELARTAIDHACRNAQERSLPHFELTFHGGGEPVQAWHVLREATAYARSKDLPCRVSMSTNAVWTARQREWILRNLDGLSVSFDGTRATQDRQRPYTSGRGSFNAVMCSLKAMDEAKFSYGIRMTATAPWRERLPEDVRFICEETGCPAMQVEPAFNTRRGEHQGPTQEESEAFVEAFMEAFEIARRAGRQLTYSGARPWLLASTFCTAPYGALVVNTDGDLVACYEVADENHPLAGMSIVGHVLDGEIVVDERARGALLAHLEGKRASCRGCFCYWHCAGDCYTRSAAAARAGGTPGPRCFMNREITVRILLWYIMEGNGVWRGGGGHPQEAQLMRTF